jgi:hypothetical protein
MATRQHFYAESLSTDSTNNTSGSAALKVELAWQPDANSDYFVFSSAAFNNSSAVDDHVGAVELFDVGSSTSLAYQAQQTKELSTPIDWYPFNAIAKLSYGASPAAQSLRLIFYSSNAGDTTQCRDARICVIKADAADQYAETLAQISYTSSTAATRVGLTFTPASTGDYLVIACAELAGDVNGQSFAGRLVHSGVATYAPRTMSCKDDFDSIPFFFAIKKTSLSGSQTFNLQYNSGTNGQTNYIQNARILALRLDGFANNYSAQTNPGAATGITNQTTYQDALTLTATPVASPHLIVACMDWNPNSTTISGYAEFNNGAQVQEWDRENSNGSAYIHNGFFQIAELANASTTWKWRVKTEGNFTLNRFDLAIHILELGPYTATASFDGAIQAAIAATASANVAVLTSLSATSSADVAAQLLRSLSAAFDGYADAAGGSVVTAQADFDAAVLAAVTVALSAGGAVELGRSLVTSLDAAAQVLGQAQGQLDAAVKASLSISVGASVAVQETFLASASLDAAAQALRIAATAFDGAVLASGSATAAADVNVVVLGAGAVTAALDAAIMALAQASAALDGAVLATLTTTIAADAALLGALSQAVALTVAVSQALSIEMVADAVVSRLLGATAGFDAAVYRLINAALGCDCYVSGGTPILTITPLVGSRSAAAALAATRQASNGLVGERTLNSALDGKVN